MDPVIFAGMIFTILVLGLVGGFTLLYQLMCRLGVVLGKQYLGDGTGGGNAEEVARLRQA